VRVGTTKAPKMGDLEELRPGAWTVQERPHREDDRGQPLDAGLRIPRNGAVGVNRGDTLLRQKRLGNGVGRWWVVASHTCEQKFDALERVRQRHDSALVTNVVQLHGQADPLAVGQMAGAAFVV